MGHIGRFSAHEQLFKAGAYGVEIAFLDKDTRHMGASDCLAHTLVRQHLGLADLIAELSEEFHDLCKTRPARLADFLEFFLKFGVVDINTVAQYMHFVLRIARSKTDTGDDVQAAGSIMSALVEFRNPLHTVMVRDGNIVQPRSLCCLDDLLRRILAVGKGRMNMQIAWHRILLDQFSSRMNTRSIFVMEA